MPMNKYGFFYYEYQPNYNAQYDLTVYYTPQQNCHSIQKEFGTGVYGNYRDFATFEPHKFRLDHPYNVWNGYVDSWIPMTTQELANEQGQWESFIYQRIEITNPSEPYNFDGITLSTFNDWYYVVISVTDERGTNVYRFEKTEDESYYFPVVGFVEMIVTFTQISPYNFLKVAGFRLGARREITEETMIGEPEIVNKFTMLGEQEYSTLDVTVVGTRDEWKINRNAKLTYSRTGRNFYVSDYSYNEDGTLSITAYDHMYRLENQKYGGYAYIMELAARGQITNLLRGYGYLHDAIPYTEISLNVDALPAQQNIDGIIQPTNCRDALSQMLTGSLEWLKWVSGNSYKLVRPDYNNHSDTPSASFTVDNIVSVPTIEYSDAPKVMRVTRHSARLANPKDASVDYRMAVPVGETQVVNFEDVANTCNFYYVISVDQDGNDILEPVVLGGNLTVIESDISRVKYSTTLTQPIVITRPHYEDNETIWTVTNASAYRFTTDELEISDVCVSVTNGTAEWLDFLWYVLSFATKVTFDSVLEANAGDYVTVNDGKTLNYYGWITSKTERLNGVFTYEVMINRGADL